jgi:hypothetical protein
MDNAGAAGQGTVTAAIGLLGPLAVVVMLLVLALISRRMGRVTHAPPYYLGLIVAAALVAAGLAARALGVDAIADETAALLLFAVLPALGMTLGLLAAWRYWSWLVAERS